MNYGKLSLGKYFAESRYKTQNITREEIQIAMKKFFEKGGVIQKITDTYEDDVDRFRPRVNVPLEILIGLDDDPFENK
tara:strand:+ start:130 stop:363 length:234 start_codon:yes stop_codon:yes gene_type:complete